MIPNPLRTFLFLFTFFLCQNSFAQEGEVSSLVQAMKTEVRSSLEEKGLKLKPIHLPVLLDGKIVDQDSLDRLSFGDLREVKLVLDKKYTILFGASGQYGVIALTSIEKQEEGNTSEATPEN